MSSQKTTTLFILIVNFFEIVYTSNKFKKQTKFWKVLISYPFVFFPLEHVKRYFKYSISVKMRYSNETQLNQTKSGQRKRKVTAGILSKLMPWCLGHWNIKTQGITTVISLLYWARWNHDFVSLWISTLMTS